MDIKKVRKEAEAQGWNVTPTKKGLMFYSPDGRTQVLWHLTPSDQRAEKNFLAALRQAGYIDPSREERKKKEKREGGQ